MRNLIGYDFKKLTYQKIFLFFFAVLLVCNGFFIYREITDRSVQNERELTAFIEEYKKDPEAMEAYMADYDTLWEASQNASLGGEAVAPPANVYSAYDALLFNRFAELRDLNQSYEALLDSAKKASSGMLKEYAYLGYAEDRFEVVYQRMVLASYEPLTRLTFPLENVVGYDIFFEYNGFCVFLLLGVALLGIQIITEERSASMLALLHTSKRGRHETMFSKIVVGFSITVLLCVLFMATSLSVLALRIGLFGWNLPIQMVEAMQLCPYEITIGEGILLSLLIQIFTSFGFLVCVMMLAVLMKNPLAVFASVVVLIGANFAIANYNFFDGYSFFRNINLFWCLDGARVLSVFRGVRVFGRCFAMFPTWLFLYLLIGIAASIAAIFLFANSRLTKKTRVRRWVSLPVPAKKRVVYPFGLYRFEVKKLCSLLTAIVIFVSMGLLLRLSDDAYHKQRNYEMNFYSDYMKRVEGPWTEEKHAQIESDYLTNIAVISRNEAMRLGYENGTVTHKEYSEHLLEYLDAEIKQSVLRRLYDRSLRLQTLNQEGKKAAFFDDTGWLLLKETNLAWVMCLAIVIICADIVSMEYRSGFRSIQRVAGKGRWHTVLAKLKACMTAGILLGAVSELCQFAFACIFSGTPGAGYSALSMEIAFPFSVGVYFLTVAVKNVLLYAGLALLTAGVSGAMKRLIPTLFVMTSLIFAPMVFSYFGIPLFDRLSLLNLFAR